MAKKAEYTKPASQLDLEARLDNENKSSRILSTSDLYEAPEDDETARVMQVKGNKTDEYIGVDPMYQNYASKTDQPLRAEEGPDKTVTEQFLANLDPKPELPEEESKEGEEEETGNTGGTSGVVTPAANPDNQK